MGKERAVFWVRRGQARGDLDVTRVRTEGMFLRIGIGGPLGRGFVSRAGWWTMAAAFAVVVGFFASSAPARANSTGTCSESGTSTVTVTCTAGSGTWTTPAG